MTASRVQGSQRIRSNTERDKEKRLGMTAVVEDWHAKNGISFSKWFSYFTLAESLNLGSMETAV